MVFPMEIQGVQKQIFSVFWGELVARIFRWMSKHGYLPTQNLGFFCRRNMGTETLNDGLVDGEERHYHAGTIGIQTY